MKTVRYYNTFTGEVSVVPKPVTPRRVYLCGNCAVYNNVNRPAVYLLRYRSAASIVVCEEHSMIGPGGSCTRYQLSDISPREAIAAWVSDPNNREGRRFSRRT